MADPKARLKLPSFLSSSSVFRPTNGASISSNSSSSTTTSTTQQATTTKTSSHPAADGKPAFWASLKIEIEPPYDGKPPEWHMEQSDSMSIPAQISSSPSDTDTGLSHMGTGDESYQVPPKAEPPLAKRITTCVSYALVGIGAAQFSLQIALLVQLHYISSWWSGTFSILVGMLGLGRWECTRITHRTCAIMGILLNAIAAVLESRIETILQDPGLFCGPPAQGTGGTTNLSVRDYCAMSSRTLDVLTCGCIIPGSDPGSKNACLAFHGRSTDCYGSAFYLRNLMGLSVALCWTLAVVCLVACLARLVFTCYKQHVCPAQLTSIYSFRSVMRTRRQKGQTTRKLQASSVVGVLDSESSSFSESQRPWEGKGKNLLSDPYFMRDGPSVGSSSSTFRASPSFPSRKTQRDEDKDDEEEGQASLS